MRRILFSCFCGLLWSSSGWAADPLGTININLHGNVVDFSCTVNTADIDKTVDLGRWPTTQLLNAGDTTALVPFSLRLEGCPPGSVAILFTGTPASDTNLLALDDPAMAQTVAIELRNSDRSRLALGRRARLRSRCKWQCHTKLFCQLSSVSQRCSARCGESGCDIYDQL